MWTRYNRFLISILEGNKMKIKMKLCIICEKRFKPPNNKYPPIQCCEKCFNQLPYAMEKSIEKHCIICKRLFKQSKKEQVTCGDIICQRERRRLVNKRYAKEKSPDIFKKCVVCGDFFHPTRNSASQSCCSKKCSSVYSINMLQAWRLSRKHIVINIYSKGTMCCKNCGYDNIDGLSIDHIKNNGGQHRRDINMPINDWLINNNFPGIDTDYQVLCMNCQFKKKHNGGKL